MHETKPSAELGRSSLGTIAIMLLGVAAMANATARAQTSAPPDAARPSAGSSTEADSEAAHDLPSPEAAEASKLRFTIAPYVWAPSLNGNITIKRATIDIDESFLDIIKDSDRVFGLMGALDLQYERFVFQFNGTWMTADVSDQDGDARNVDIDANVTLNTTWLELFAGYRIVETPLGDDPEVKRFLTLDAFVGGRVTMVDVDADLKASATITLPGGTVLNPSASKTLSPSESWIEPFIGLRLGANLSERWAITLRGDIGGFGAGSDFAWQAFGGVGYRWFTESGSITLFGGYRALSQDYTNGDFTWDLTVHGPMIGVAFTF